MTERCGVQLFAKAAPPGKVMVHQGNEPIVGASFYEVNELVNQKKLEASDFLIGIVHELQCHEVHYLSGP